MSNFKRRTEYAHIPDAPKPTTSMAKFSHCLPLPLHLILAFLTSVAHMLVALLAHVFDGGIKDSWSYRTTIIHSMMKSALLTHPPQGRHSFGFVRFLTSYSIPGFLFRNTTFQPVVVQLEGSSNLLKSVLAAFGIAQKLIYIPAHDEKRSIVGELIISKLAIEPLDRAQVLYLHGGAHLFMSPNSHRSITSEIAKICNADVLCLDYRLSPEAPFPSAVCDALACYLAMIGCEDLEGTKASIEGGSYPIAPSKIFLIGDSSGACLVLQLLQVIKALNLPMPVGAVLLSPFLDHELKAKSWSRNWNSDFLSLDMKGVEWAMNIYSNGLPPFHPAISPLNGDLSNLPPLLIQSGDSEVVTDDAIALHSLGSLAGSSIELQLYQDMFHVWVVFPHLSQSKLAFKNLKIFVDATLEPSGSDSGVSVDSAISYFGNKEL